MMLHSWHEWFTFTGVVFMTVLGLPVAALVVWALASRRIVTGTRRAWAWRRSLTEVAIVYGTVPWVWMTLMPGSPGSGGVSLVPLRDLATMGTLGAVGNLLVFAALGFFGPMRFTALTSVPRVLALGAACSLLIETAQYVLRLDRVSSVDDVLLNATGAGLAALLARHWWRAPARAECVSVGA
jgi:glycopeptide antibiotics resistance protein